MGAGTIALIPLGNPEYMGICISCYISHLSGSLGLHSNTFSQFPRPELIGILLGSYIFSLIRKQHHPYSTGDFLIRFIIGFSLMVGAVVFVGCPLRALFRISFGDFSALIGISGLITGVWFGTGFEKAGFYLKGKIHTEKEKESWVLPVVAVLFFIGLALGGVGLQLSEKGTGAVYAPIFLTLMFGAIVGALGQRSRFCTVAGIKNFIIGRDIHLLIGIGVLIFSATSMNLLLGKYMAGFLYYPGTNTAYVWDFISMFLVGIGAAFLDGCPFRIIVRAGQGDTDSVPVLMGMILAGGMTQTLNIASGSAGTTSQGKISVLSGIFLLSIFGYIRIRKEKN